MSPSSGGAQSYCLTCIDSWDLERWRVSGVHLPVLRPALLAGAVGEPRARCNQAIAVVVLDEE